MTIFFLLVSLELKREFLEGELSGFNKIILPGISALGGMVVPALIYLGITFQHGVAAKGWAIPVATDIAFALGVLSLFGKRIPVGLKLFLMALAIFDDVGAIIIIAVVHSHHLSHVFLGMILVLVILLCLLNRMGVKSLIPYIFVGFLLWFCVLSSGVHATVAGVILGLIIPLQVKNKEDIQPLVYLEDRLHPWVAFFVMPLFAFANSGVSFAGLTWNNLFNPIPLGIMAGLVIGKQCGVFSCVWLMVKTKWAKLPDDTDWFLLYAVAMLCGIGFTMSLFLGTLAFQDEVPQYLVEVRIGVLLASIISGVIGAIVLHVALLRQTKRRLPA
jgi:NhaA family Na+:H+ antiporter